MKNAIVLSVLLSCSVLLAHADRADMNRLLTDIENHNNQLSQVLTAKDAAAIKKSSFSLREDAKSLARKSTGLADQQKGQLEQRANEVADLTQKIDQAADKNDFAAAQAQYQGLQKQIAQLRQLAAEQPATATAKPGAPAAVGSGGGDPASDNLTDLKNHTRKLSEALKTKDAALVKTSTGFIREDLKAHVAGRTSADAAERKRLTAAETEIVALTRKIERNVAKGEWGDAREFAAKIEKLVKGVESPAATPAKKKK